jgi:hypothetical protein
MSATLQNNVRLRVFLILIIALVIRLTRINSSASVHKATGILENSFIVYGIVVLCSLLPLKATWVVAIVFQAVGVVLDAVVLGLGALATYRCRNQTGCIQTLPMSIVTIVLVLIVFTLDTMQTWDIYRIIRAPVFLSSATQRVRILLAWALPFGWLVNTINVVNSEWSLFIFTTSHLIVDPLVILMANSHENIFITTLLFATIVMDILAWVMNTHTLVNKAIAIQIALYTGALLIMFAGNQVTQEQKTKNDEEDFEVTEAKTPGLRRRKSGNDKINF